MDLTPVLGVAAALVYVVVQSRGAGRSVRSALDLLGATPGTASGYRWAAVLLVPQLAIGWLVVLLIPPEALAAPGLSGPAPVVSVAAGALVAVRALVEELFFRGLVAGVLIRRLGFRWGNLAQALVFLVAHLPLLLVDPRVWPILPLQFVAGWLLGWLRHRSGSVLPGGLVHVVVNLLAGVLTTMR
ncbi:CPBP family intramembrane glutamic endopeptidase [Pseudonocardia phyllosphaerae]|uniref:CPBP family intramembrane glutamic endopeptidase n=1 Tax=Pseudonocardia phyllosphaerae TaxID=3390502 RepID=UPI00397BE471